MFLIGLEDGVFPHVRSLGDPDELEEERRLCYVGLTRAEERLYLCHAWSRMMFGSTDYRPPSRFLDEIPAELIMSIGDEERRGKGAGPPPRRGGRGRDRATSAPVVRSDAPRQRQPAGARGAEQLGLRIGDDVTHDKFGDGVIVDITGTGDKAEARVRFRDVGEKTLLLVVGAAHARLTSRLSRSSSSPASRGRRSPRRSPLTVWMLTGYCARSDAGDGARRRTPSGRASASACSPTVGSTL